MAMTYYFPWVRKGLGMFIQEKDAYTSEKGTPVSESDLALNRPEILLTAEFLAQQGGTSFNIIHEKTVKFVGPSDIAGVSEKIVMKAVPDPSTTTFPRQYYPYVEFDIHLPPTMQTSCVPGSRSSAARPTPSS